MAFPSFATTEAKVRNALRGHGPILPRHQVDAISQITQHGFGATFKENYVGPKLRFTLLLIQIPWEWYSLSPQYCLQGCMRQASHRRPYHKLNQQLRVLCPNDQQYTLNRPRPWHWKDHVEKADTTNSAQRVDVASRRQARPNTAAGMNAWT